MAALRPSPTSASTLKRLACLGVLLACAVSRPVWAESAQETWHAAIAEGYATLATDTATMERSAAAYCAAPTKKDRQALESSWQEAFMAWQAVRFVDFGPIEQNSLAWQFQFWPDSKNTIARKANLWLKGEQPITADAISHDSVAVKGFPALEYLLFDPAASQTQGLPGARSCDLLRSISGLVHSNALALQEQWQQFRPHYLANPQFRDTTVVAAMHGIETLLNKRLANPMGLEGKPRRNPYLADAWRSEQSLTAIRASLLGLRRHFIPGLAELMTDEQGAALVAKLDQQLSSTVSRLDELPSGMGDLLSGEEGYRSLQLLFIEVDKLNMLLGGNIASALNIIRGFNSSDGD